MQTATDGFLANGSQEADSKVKFAAYAHELAATLR